MAEQLYAEDIGHYWKTSRSGSETWIEKAKREIENADGTVLREAFGSDARTGLSVFMLAFEFAPNQYRVVWPVLESKKGEEGAARRQAATMLYHDVKAKCMTAKVMGFRNAFIPYLALDSGQTVTEVTTPELTQNLAWLLPAHQGGQP